jgi:hypothetical protein
VAGGARYVLPGTGRLARRAAAAELGQAGLLETGGLKLADRGRASDRFRAVCACVDHPGEAASRDWEVLVLLAWSGVLARRLNKDERRMADRRMRQLFTRAEDGVWGFPGAEYDVPAWVSRLGGPVVLDEEIDLFDSPELVEFGHDHSGYSTFG